LVKKRIFAVLIAVIMVITTSAIKPMSVPYAMEVSEYTDFIVIDQFGYLPDSQKTAVIRNPKEGVDSNLSFNPGTVYHVIKENGGTSSQLAYQGAPVHKFALDEDTGDEIWWFDFSSVTEPGRYYILDVQRNVRSFSFSIADNVYNEALKHAVRMFYYQRAAFSKEAKFAGEGWADGASHLQSKQARYFYDRNNAATERDLSGGWYDAGDYNKYTAWTAQYIESMLESYRENPDVFGDNYNIPESGNGIPDIIDEVRFGMEHLLRKQNDSSFQLTVRPTGYPNITNFDGSMISVLGVAHNPNSGPVAPSQVTGASLYGPPNTTATYAAARAFALGGVVFEEWDKEFAETLRNAATRAWNWAEANPNVMFQNNVASNNSQGLAAGGQEIESDSTASRRENRAKAGLYMYEMTGNTSYLQPFEQNYEDFPPFSWWHLDHYRTNQILMYLQYINLDSANPTIVTAIRNRLNHGFNSSYSPNLITDGYRSFLNDYPWGSNRAKSEMGITLHAWAENNMIPARNQELINAANDYVHYIHGVNPFNRVYLTNMNSYGAGKSLTSIYHEWFAPGSRWSKVGVSEVGPAPGYLAGGPNAGFNIERGDTNQQFPNNFWGYTLTPHELQLATHIRNNLVGSPPAKMYMDINDGWPINTWEITEPHGGYQVAYIRLLSKFAAPVQIDDGDPDHLYISTVNTTENNGWLEITNPTDKAVSTKGLYLSVNPLCIGSECGNCNDEDFCNWQMPSVIIRPGIPVRIRMKNNNACITTKRLRSNFDFNNMTASGKVYLFDSVGNELHSLEIS
jgi:hypothetical protein